MSLVIVSKNCSKMSMSTKYKATSKLKINTGKLLSIAYQMQINVLKKCKWSKKRNNLEKRISSPHSSTLMRILITHQNRFHNELYLQKMCNLCELLPMRNKILDLWLSLLLHVSKLLDYNYTHKKQLHVTNQIILLKNIKISLQSYL